VIHTWRDDDAISETKSVIHDIPRAFMRARPELQHQDLAMNSVIALAADA
jgi:hypothetical protein